MIVDLNEYPGYKIDTETLEVYSGDKKLRPFMRDNTPAYQLYKDGKKKMVSVRSLAKAVNVEFEKNYGDRSGSNNPNAKLEDCHIQKILKLLNPYNGYSQREIADIINRELPEDRKITRGTIAQIKAGNTWSEAGK